MQRARCSHPGESADVTITVDPYYIASYDYDDANGNGFSGYELEAGEYHFILGTNAHEAIDSFAMNVSSGITYANDPRHRYARRQPI